MKNNQVIAILGGQWGDEGKGKIVDWAGQYFEVSARATGGNNAGHTIYINGEKHVFHLIPSALTWDHVECVLGNGMVIDPLILLKEMHVLRKKGFTCNNLHISGNAHIILLLHKMMDGFQESLRGENKKIGTTKRGIGPTYADKSHRTGVRINDLFDKELLNEKIKNHIEEKLFIFRQALQDEDILHNLSQSIPEDDFFKPFKEQIECVKNLNVQKFAFILTNLYYSIGKLLKPHVNNSSAFLQNALVQDKQILLEGAQGLLLDIDHGTYPFVTSSNPSVGGLTTGLGIPQIDHVYSILKAYITRVGGGPFPTEIHGETGNYLRDKGVEFGSTTGRPRRCGWFDALIARYCSRINGKKIIITKLDVLSGLDTLRICNSYKYTGEAMYYNGKFFFPGKIINQFPSDSRVLAHCIANEWTEMPGWQEDIGKCKTFEELPQEAKDYLHKVEELGNVQVAVVSVGPKRNDTIILEDAAWTKDKKEVTLVQNEETGEVEEKRKIRAILYDLDNTLVATNEFVRTLIKKVAADISKEISFVPPNDEEISFIQSKNLAFEDIFKRLFPNPIDYKRDEPLAELVLRRYRAEAPFLPYKDTKGGVVTKKIFDNEGFIQGIVSNRIRMAEERLGQAGYDSFSFILSPQDHEDRKPSSAVFNEALERLSQQGLGKKEIVVVGDHTDDYLAAKDADLRFFAVLQGSTKEEAFINLGLNKEDIIQDLSELKDKLIEVKNVNQLF